MFFSIDNAATVQVRIATRALVATRGKANGAEMDPNVGVAGEWWACFCFAGSHPGSHPAAVILTSSWPDVAQDLSSWTEHTSSWHHPA